MCRRLEGSLQLVLVRSLEDDVAGAVLVLTCGTLTRLTPLALVLKLCVCSVGRAQFLVQFASIVQELDRECVGGAAWRSRRKQRHKQHGFAERFTASL